MQCLFPSTCLLLHHVAVATISMALDKADSGRDVVGNRSYIWMFKESQCGIQRPGGRGLPYKSDGGARHTF